MLDIYGCICYNKYRKKEMRYIKMKFWDNDFDRMFDEAVEELEREAQICAKWEEEEANRFF
jgi:hypothetical protein